MHITKTLATTLLIPFLFSACQKNESVKQAKTLDPVDYVNPYMGNISHLLVPTFPTVHLPNSMLRVIPEREDYTSAVLKGLPIAVTSHRGRSAFKLSPFNVQAPMTGNALRYSYDLEHIKPYAFDVYLDEEQIEVDFSPSHQAAIYSLRFEQKKETGFYLATLDGRLDIEGNILSGYQNLENNTRIYLYLETEQLPTKGEQIDDRKVMISFAEGTEEVMLKYGISFISIEQAKKNLEREIPKFDLETVKAAGRMDWNKALGTIEATGDQTDLTVFYTSFYRCFERPVSISEDGHYFSAFDHKVHEDDGIPFYTDDWLWDTYRAAHPLRCLIDTVTESAVINSYIRMADQMDNHWFPTFPEVTGDSRRMNSNHGVAILIDGYRKGIKGFDLAKSYRYAADGITQKTLAPWSQVKGAEYNDFYFKHGYAPALRDGQKETWAEVHSFEKRQPIAVTLGTSYDEWCLSQLAGELGQREDSIRFNKDSYNYRNVFNKETHFFHPKDDAGKFLEPFDYSWSGGMGAREYYGENNGWVYRWDVPHHIEDLVQLMGGKEQFDANLDQTYQTPLGRSKYEFYSKMPDHTGNVGQFSMANEPALHIPYLYNYTDKPWKTQKTIHKLVHEWFRNDLMGVPGDEDGGGMSSFVVFSMLGFYPITPGLPVYTIGSPFFNNAKIHLENGKTFTVQAVNYSSDNKYIQSATINGISLDKAQLTHKQILEGGTLKLVMGPKANRAWGIGLIN
ncbi:MAG: GH92 family glycosyl hydrolase [Bacteroidaceae bacterium]